MKDIYSRLGRGFLYSLLAQGGSYLIAFFLAPIYARAMAPEEYAVVSFANSLRNILIMLMPMGVGGAVVYWYNQYLQDSEKQKKSVGGIALLSIMYSAFWFVSFSVTGKTIIEKGFGDIGLPFFPYGFVIGLSAFLYSFSTVPTSLFIAKEKVALNSILSTLMSLLQTAIIILFVAFLKKGAKGQINAVLIAGIISFIIYFFFMIKDTRLSFDIKLFKEVSKFSIPFLPHSLFMWILNLSDRMIISYFGKEYIKDLGFYSFGYAIGMVMQGVMGAFNTIWSAVFMKEANSNVKAQEVLGKAGSYGILLLAYFASSLILFSKEAIIILSSGRYEESAKYVPPVVLGYFFQGLYMFPGMALYHLKKTHLYPVITGVGAVVNILVNIYGIPRWGVMTAAVATAIGFCVMALLSFIFGHFPYPLNYKLFPILFSFLMLGFSFLLVYMFEADILLKICTVFFIGIVGIFMWYRDYIKGNKSEEPIN
ncbi:MAG: oligosaccharide flippase family protein [Acidobacteria bacterium]|nr:oligosaccharide flippase family protein [Acidobacteriota bacterium]